MSADFDSRLETARGDSRESTLTAVLQKAQSASAALQRIEEQMLSLVEQRRKMLADLKGVQAQINDEFDRVFRAKKAAEVNGNGNGNGSGTHSPVRVEVNGSVMSRTAVSAA
jgi:hypothetical protein